MSNYLLNPSNNYLWWQRWCEVWKGEVEEKEGRRNRPQLLSEKVFMESFKVRSQHQISDFIRQKKASNEQNKIQNSRKSAALKNCRIKFQHIDVKMRCEIFQCLLLTSNINTKNITINKNTNKKKNTRNHIQ